MTITERGLGDEARQMTTLVSPVDVPETLPLIPWRNTVLFPGGVAPMAIGARGTRAIEAAVNGLIVVATCRDPNVEDPTAADLFEVGVVARVTRFEPGPDGCAITVQGLARCRLETPPEPGPHLRARVVVIEQQDQGADPDEIETFRTVAHRIVHRSPEIPLNAHELVRDIENPSHLIDLVVANLTLSIADKQRILEVPALKERFVLALELLNSVLAQLPVLPVGDRHCSPHQMSAVAWCARCGAFVCEECLGFGRASDLCRDCRVRRDQPAPHARLVRQLEWASVAAAGLVLVGGGWTMREIPVIGGLIVMALAFSGLAAGVSAVRMDRDRPPGDLLRPATIGIGLSGFLSLAYGWEVVLRTIK